MLFKTIADFNLKLCIAKVGKLNVCGRSLFSNSVTNMKWPTSSPCLIEESYPDPKSGVQI